jgi:hypothetical protein
MSPGSRLATVLSLMVTACGGGDDTTGPGGNSPAPTPVAGVVSVKVDSRDTDTGAMLFSVTGAFRSMAASAGYQLLSYAPGTGETRVMVIGSIVPGAVFQLNVADKSKPVFVTLQQVAGKDYARRSPGDYHVTVDH